MPELATTLASTASTLVRGFPPPRFNDNPPRLSNSLKTLWRNGLHLSITGTSPMDSNRLWIHLTRRISAIWNSRPSLLGLGTNTPSRISCLLTLSTLSPPFDRLLVDSKLYPNSPPAFSECVARFFQTQPFFLDLPACRLFYVCILHVHVVFSFSLDQICYPSIIRFVFPSQFPPLFSSFVLELPTAQPLPQSPQSPTLPSSPLWISECCFITLFFSPTVNHRKVYIYTSVCARIVFLPFYATSIPTALVGEDLDLGFPDDADWRIIEPRG